MQAQTLSLLMAMLSKIVFFSLFCIFSATAAERPNILWITSEDNDYGWLGCYGNKQAKTPRIDQLAANGLLFKHAYSNAPVCAVARSTILNGVYATTMGTQHMRSRHPIPASYKPYVSYLKKLGYYCTNNSKTDYNFKGNDRALWDACSSRAHYKNRPDSAPFFAIFNLTVSHESSLFPAKIANNKKRGIIPKNPRVDPAKVEIRPYLPDLPGIRSDIATYHDTITALDTQVGKIIDDLKAAGLADDTIIFHYSDHGGITPRGKRYLKDSGVRVPMIVHIPKKWQHLSPFKPGEKIEEPIAFIDLAPTLLSLAGMEKPTSMQGRAFLGSKRVAPEKDSMVFLFADRFDEIYGMRRGLTDGRWKYIRRFTPHLAAAPYSNYQYGQAGWNAWHQAWKDGKLTDGHKAIWEGDQPVEELFDLMADPWEVKNLAADPAHAKRLKKMRTRLAGIMVKTKDTGVIPEPMFPPLSGKKTIANYLAEHADKMPEFVDLALAASSRDPKNLPDFIANQQSANPITRYWAVQGCLILGKAAAPAEAALRKNLDDAYSPIRVAAAHALINIGKKEAGRAAIIAEMSRNMNEYALQNTINTMNQLDLLEEIPDSWIDKTLKDKKAGPYVKRLAKKLRKNRKK